MHHTKSIQILSLAGLLGLSVVLPVSGYAAPPEHAAHVDVAALIKAADYPEAESIAAIKAKTVGVKARYVLQISDADAQKRGMDLKVAAHLLKYYGKGKVDVEIVAFGPGLKLLLADNNPQAPMIAKLSAEGVRFSACGNAIHHATQMLGYAPKLVPAARVVPAGIVRVHDLAMAGYFADKP
ncbi:DsrE family protein [Halothiobacillus sp. 15-55-196]|jgi:intracellular sulfur oxidation DsrE/DsrF family protein|uniref:DsrE family protein n=1 Tax=Halothiobacillus sp. 15-55-196 TaxID=1970382 RepID=UPI0025BE8566|nr:DsrE family protein [Halothiobacillus sp. 15-55-196]